MATTPGQNVRAEMARRSESQAEIAQLLGLSQAAISRRLSGAVDFSATELATLAAHFVVPVGALFTEPALAEGGDVA